MPDVVVLTAIFPHPEVPCQPKDRQAWHKPEELHPNHGGNDIPYFAVKTDCLYHLVAGRKQASQHRDEHRPFAVDEHGSRGEPDPFRGPKQIA